MLFHNQLIILKLRIPTNSLAGKVAFIRGFALMYFYSDMAILPPPQAAVKET